MEISFWNGHPLHGGQRIAGNVIHDDDGTISFRTHQGGTYAEVFAMQDDGHLLQVWPASRG